MDIPEIVQFAAALLFVLALIILIAWALRRFFGASAGRAAPAPGRRRARRLGVIEATPIGTRHRLVLVRRDDVEHLLLIGGSSEVVVERSIPLLDAEAEVNIRAVEPRFDTAPAAAPAADYGAPAYERPRYEPSHYEPTIPRRAPPPRPSLETREAPEPEPTEGSGYRFSRSAPPPPPPPPPPPRQEPDYDTADRGYSEAEEIADEPEQRRDALSDLAARYSGRSLEAEESNASSYEREPAYEGEGEAEEDDVYEIDDTGEEPPEPPRRESPILSRFLKRDER